MPTDCFPEAPAAWSRNPVSCIARVNPRYPVSKGQEYPFVEMSSVGENFRGITGFDTRKMEGSGLSRFRTRDTLFAKITPCPENGKIAFVGDLPAETGLGSTEFIVLSPRDGCSPRFLYHLLCSHEVRGRAAARMEGSTGRQRVPEEVFEKRLTIPVPPPEEQIAIARILDAVDTAIDCTHEAVVRARGLTSSLIQEFFFGALGETAYADRPTKSLPSGWQLLPTDELLEGEPKNGISPKTSSQPPGIPTFSIAAVRQGKVNLRGAEHLKYAQVSEKIAADFVVNTGDILIVRGNANPDLVGKAGMIGEYPDGCIYPDITKRVVFRKKGECAVIPDFALLAWNHSIVHNQILRRAKTSNGTLKINSRDVKQVVIPVPPLKEQTVIVNMVAAAENREEGLARVLSSYQQLKKSLMHDLLTGRVRARDVAGSVEAMAEG
ncbi:MAG: restriction endonuclease subunit S [Candidatus Methylomirabilia bacterium]